MNPCIGKPVMAIRSDPAGRFLFLNSHLQSDWWDMDEEQLEIQRDYYQFLLRVDSESSISPDEYLSEALRLVVEITGADLGYVELRDVDGKTWWSTHMCNEKEIERIRKRISSGIIAQAIASGETIVTPSAFLDPRFKNHASVQTGRIDAVLCSPIHDGETVGVIYLHQKGGDYGDSKDNIMDAELFSRHISPLLRGLRKQMFPPDPMYAFHDVIGRGTAFQRTLKEIMTVADLNVTVLLKGETGVGKTKLAGIIHENSSRHPGPFIHINCANLQENLVESELFGAVKGSHSSAFADQKGKIASASGGTLFLDEIGELPVSVQAKLLQFIEEGFYFPLGSNTREKPDVRVITASNIDFEKAIQRKTFRQDLFYRISVFPIHIPPLRERMEEIPEFLRFFVKKYCDRFKIPLIKTPASTVAIMRRSNWPGNIRQLENVVQQAVLRARSEFSNTLLPGYIFHVGSPDQNNQASKGLSYREEKEIWEKSFILDQLNENMWNISKTAKKLGLSRSHMNNLIKTHNLKREPA